MKETRSLSKFSRLSELTRLYPNQGIPSSPIQKKKTELTSDISKYFE